MHFKDFQKDLHLLRLLPRPVPILELDAHFREIFAIGASNAAKLVFHLRLLLSLDLLYRGGRLKWSLLLLPFI